MTTKIKILILAAITFFVTAFIFVAAQLTKLADSDILDISFDDDVNGEF